MDRFGQRAPSVHEIAIETLVWSGNFQAIPQSALFVAE